MSVLCAKAAAVSRLSVCIAPQPLATRWALVRLITEASTAVTCEALSGAPPGAGAAAAGATGAAAGFLAAAFFLAFLFFFFVYLTSVTVAPSGVATADWVSTSASEVSPACAASTDPEAAGAAEALVEIAKAATTGTASRAAAMVARRTNVMSAWCPLGVTGPVRPRGVALNIGPAEGGVRTGTDRQHRATIRNPDEGRPRWTREHGGGG